MTRQERILEVASDLLPNLPEVWDQGYITLRCPVTASGGERAIAEALAQLWSGVGAIGYLATRVDRESRAAILELIDEAP